MSEQDENEVVQLSAEEVMEAGQLALQIQKLCEGKRFIVIASAISGVLVGEPGILDIVDDMLGSGLFASLRETRSQFARDKGLS